MKDIIDGNVYRSILGLSYFCFVRVIMRFVLSLEGEGSPGCDPFPCRRHGLVVQWDTLLAMMSIAKPVVIVVTFDIHRTV